MAKPPEFTRTSESRKGSQAGGRSGPRPPSAPPSWRAQGLALLSRREHSREELRSKLLAAWRKRVQAALRWDEHTQRGAARQQDAADDAGARAPGPVANPQADPQVDAFLDAFGEAPVSGPRVQAAAQLLASLAAARRAPSSPGAPVPAGVAPAPPFDPEHDPAPDIEAALDWLAARGYLNDARFVEARLHSRAPRMGQRRLQAELSRLGVALDADQQAQLRETELDRARALWQRKFGQVETDPKARARQARFLAARGFGADVVYRLIGGRPDDDA